MDYYDPNVNVAVVSDHIEVVLVNINAVAGQGVVNVVVAASHVTDVVVIVTLLPQLMEKCL